MNIANKLTPMKSYLLIAIVLILSCNKNKNNYNSSDAASVVKIPEVATPLDTSSVIGNIKKMYLFMQNKKNAAKYETDNNRNENIDTSSIEYSGDYSITETWDTTYTISDSLYLHVSDKKEENQMGDFYSRSESYYKRGELFFTFSRVIRETPFIPNNSGISETRTYYYGNKPIKCLFRELITDDISKGDSITKIATKKCDP
jgi:hypothetical protein